MHCALRFTTMRTSPITVSLRLAHLKCSTVKLKPPIQFRDPANTRQNGQKRRLNGVRVTFGRVADQILIGARGRRPCFR